jgi:predicted nucleic acid-binding protein
VAVEGILIDTGPLVAILSRRDEHHPVCVTEAKTLRGPFYTAWPVVTEAAYLLRNDRYAVDKLLSQIDTAKLRLLHLAADDVPAIATILRKYADQSLDFADAVLMHLTEREGIKSIFTVDRRHFTVYRSPTGQGLNLFPAAL